MAPIIDVTGYKISATTICSGQGVIWNLDDLLMKEAASVLMLKTPFTMNVVLWRRLPVTSIAVWCLVAGGGLAGPEKPRIG